MMNKKQLRINTAYFDQDSNSIFKDSFQNSENQSPVDLQNQTTFVRQYYHQPQDVISNQKLSNLRLKERQFIENEMNNKGKESSQQFKNSYRFLKNRPQPNQISNHYYNNKLQNSSSLRYLNKKKNLVKELHLIEKHIPLVYTDCFSYENSSQNQKKDKKIQNYKTKNIKREFMKTYLANEGRFQQQKQIKSKRNKIYEDILQKLNQFSRENVNQQEEKKKITHANKSHKKVTNCLLNDLQYILIHPQNNQQQNRIQQPQNIQKNTDEYQEYMQKANQRSQRQILYDKIKNELQILKIQVRQLAQADMKPVTNVNYSQNLQKRTILSNQKNYIVKNNPQTFHVQNTYKPISIPQNMWQPNYQIKQGFGQNSYIKKVQQGSSSLNINKNYSLYPHIKLSNQQVRVFKIPYSQNQKLQNQKKVQQEKQQIAYYPYLKQKILLQLQQQS